MQLQFLFFRKHTFSRIRYFLSERFFCLSYLTFKKIQDLYSNRYILNIVYKLKQVQIGETWKGFVELIQEQLLYDILALYLFKNII